MTTVTLDSNYDTAEIKKRDWRIIALIGVAHSCSHFFQLVIPTLYVFLAHEFGYDFVRLGGLATAFFVVSGIGQASSGFIVDRIGPTPVLHFGLSCFVASGILIGLADGYTMLLLAAVIGGAGNSVFHPVDYSIINHRISPLRLGHAFSIHGLTGNLGWALTPLFITGIGLATSWRVAAFSAAALVAVVLLLTILGRNLLSGSQEQADAQGPEAEESSAGDLSSQSIAQTLLTLGRQPALWGAFLFFASSSVALSSVQNYTIPMLGDVYGISRVLAGSALSGYMVTAALGMLAGGFLVGATAKTERIVFVALVSAGLMLVLLASGVLPPPLAMVIVGLAGFCSGVAAPSRDMLIRRVTPKGATGTVYGLVYSGMDVGASLAPLVFGIMLDAGYTRGPWVGAAVAFCLSATLAVWVASQATRTAQAK
ncbi:MFS transporter [Paenalcaligenes niemegkensis]|uniref:MFS transporter n=1 Tax=Paenalcaligenes niemegkensis TaxID=2895469 RepID=UPI001EE873AD|nr:MFS transporter [Paenalcaligenes niemegkensis]MCQ9616768.1 MFS transporter [Paenalcaligenes niemegkensis]